MRPSRPTSSLLVLACFPALSPSCAGEDQGDDDDWAAAAPAELVAAPPGPAPEGYVITPNGLFHASCVIQLGPDEQARGDGKIARADGTIREVAPCRYPHYDRSGRAISPDGSASSSPPQISGWVEDSSDTTHGPYRSISADWKVPSAPAIDGPQVVYYFPGLESLANTQTIVQPVLGWSHGWTIASWNCCKDGNVNHSPPVTVKAGDTIHGTASGSGCSTSTGQCTGWQITTSDQTTGMSTTLNTSNYGQAFDWVFGGVLEAYSVDSCPQYPASGSVLFSNIAVKRIDGTSPTITWPSGGVRSPLSPSCSYAVTGGSTVKVQAKPTPPKGARLAVIEAGGALRTYYAGSDGSLYETARINGTWTTSKPGGGRTLKYRGKFDQGWDGVREETFARQKQLGVIPPDCELTKRPDGIAAWDDVDDDLKPVLAREMENYAGFLEHADHQVGRLIDALDALGVLGDTLVYYKGWSAVTKHRTPWEYGLGTKTVALDDDVWELYDGTKDWTQARDLAKEEPEKLHELQRLFLIEAAKYNVLPLDDRVSERLNPVVAGRPRLITGSSQLLFPGMGGLNENCVVDLKNKSHAITAELVVPSDGANGVLINQGGRTGGWALYVDAGRLMYIYNFIGIAHFKVAATRPLPSGQHQVRMEFAYDGGGLGKGGNVTFYVDGQPVGSGRVERTHMVQYSFDETTDVGQDTGSPVTDDYVARDSLHRHGQVGPTGPRRR
jgi:hypothetical protein